MKAKSRILSLLLAAVLLVGLMAAPALASDLVQVDVFTVGPGILETLSAWLVVNVSGSGLGSLLIMSEGLFDAPVEVGEGKTRVYVAAAPAAEVYEIGLYSDGELVKTTQLTVMEYNTDTWVAAAFINESGNLAVKFNADITINKDVSVNGNPVSFSVSDDVVSLEYSEPTENASIKLAGVKMPLLFPSYSFTYTVLYEADNAVKLIAASEQKSLASLVPETAYDDGNGNFEVFYFVTSLSGNIETFPYFTIKNVENPALLELRVGNDYWDGYKDMAMAEVQGMPGVYQKVSSYSVHWERGREDYPDYVVWTVLYAGNVVGTFKVTVDITE